jgi:ferrous iron transport protein B
MPQIVILTIALELLEASGYLARGAFLVDRFLRVMGLSGRSFLPLLMGHACAVPAISATRIIRDPRERLTTILVIPLMACSARLPTYGLVLAAFFSEHSSFFRAGLFVALYFAGIFAGLVASLVMRRTATRGTSLPLVLEMPSYRMPQAAVVARKAATAARRFTREVGTTILAVSIVLWLLLSIPMPGARRTESPIESSVAAWVGQRLEPVTKPAGFDWRVNVGLIGSFGAREVMVGTMGVIFGIESADEDPEPLTKKLREATENGRPLYTTRTGLSLLTFFVLACQCMSTVAAIRRETKSLRWPAFVLGYTYTLGWAAAVVVYQLASALGVR